MATAKMLEYTIGLVIVILVFFLIGGCVTKFLNPKCDLRAVDAFEKFNEIYINCMAKNSNDVCKCEEFNIQSLPPDYKLLLTPYVKDNKNTVMISLVCNGRNAKAKYLEDKNIRVYFSDPEKFEKFNNLDINLMNKIDNTDSKKLNWIYTEQGNKIRENKIYLSEEILQGGFEIKNELNSHNVKGVGLLFGSSNMLSLVNLNGKVAFMANTKTQGKTEILTC